MNRVQDLRLFAYRVAWNAGADPLLLWNPDETTLAWAQLYLPAGRWRSLASTGASVDLTATPANAMAKALVVSLVPGSWSREQWLEYLRGDPLTYTAGANEPFLSAAGFSEIGRVERPGGRGYFLWRRSATTQTPGAMQ